MALDGSKIKADASKHKAMSYKRMKEEEARLEAEVRRLLQMAEAVDEEEDQRYGKNKRGNELPRELAFRDSRLKKIREAKKALEVRPGKKLSGKLRKGRGQRTKRSVTSLTPIPALCLLLEASTLCRPTIPRRRWTACARLS